MNLMGRLFLHTRSYHVPIKALKSDDNQSAILMQNTTTDVSATLLLLCAFNDTSRMINVHAIKDSAPPTLGMIATDFNIDVGQSDTWLLIFRFSEF